VLSDEPKLYGESWYEKRKDGSRLRIRVESLALFDLQGSGVICGLLEQRILQRSRSAGLASTLSISHALLSRCALAERSSFNRYWSPII